MENLKYGIIGSGAIGGFYGGKLANAKKDVHFLFHSDYEYILQNGLKINSIDGNFIVDPIHAYKRTVDMPLCDVVFVSLKTTKNYLLKTLLAPILKENTTIILIQNGLNLEADLHKEFPDHQIAGAMAFICSAKVGNGYIQHMDKGNINIGSYSCKSLDILKLVKADFEDAEVDCNIVDLEPARWQKLIWNIPFNGMAVVLNTTTDIILKNKATKELIRTLMLEVISGANAIGKNKFVIEETLADKMLKTTEEMTPYAPSMKLDFDNRRELELEYIYNRPICEADRVGYEMKSVRMLFQQLSFIQSQYLTE